MIIGLGNEYLSDDGVGIRVVRALRERLPTLDAVIEELSVGGLELLTYITGCERCVIVDAVTTGTHPPGTTYRCIQKTGSDPPALTSSHQINLAQVVSLGAMMGADLPAHLLVYGVEAEDLTTFHDGCTVSVSEAIPRIVDVICHDIKHEAQTLAKCGSEEWQIISEVFPD